MLSIAVFAAVVVSVLGDITGTNPPAGSCLCMAFTSVNVRNGPCATVIGQANPPQCFVGNGVKQSCVLSGVTYEFFSLQFGGVTGWIAGDYMNLGSSSQCASGGSGNCADVQVVSRAEWGARPPSNPIPALPSKPVGMGFVHHTVTGRCYDQAACSAIVRSVQNYHMDTNGWPDIAYNFLIGEDGRAYEGRGWDKVGAHTYGYNDNAVAVCAIGDFTGSPPNAAGLAALDNTFDCAIRQGVLSNNYEMFGHRDGGCTACPGDQLYATIRTWPQYSFRDIPNYCSKDEHDD